MNSEENRSENWIALTLFLAVILVFMLGYKPTELPRPWFDEGWTLSTAKNWAENGVHALRLEDKWVSPEAMAQPLTVTIPIAFSLRMFGVGILQGCLPGILFTIGTLMFLFLLAQQIYSTEVAWGLYFSSYCLLQFQMFNLRPSAGRHWAKSQGCFICLPVTGFWDRLRKQT